MEVLTGIERIGRIIRREPVDRIGLYEHIWDETIVKWTQEGHLKEKEPLSVHFGFDLDGFNPFKLIADTGIDKKIIEETDEAVLYEDGNGVIQKRLKNVTNVPQWVDFKVKGYREWESEIKPLLKPDKCRLDMEGYRKARESARKNNQFFVCSSMNVFELMRALCGHECMLVGMALEPEWIKDMVDVYSQLIVDLMEILFSEAGQPDGVWFYEDMGFKEHPFISPAMYREIIQPGHRKTMQFAHSRKLPVICHSCGMVEPLIPGMIESGVDCLQAMEVKAGMNVVELSRKYGKYLSLMGGIDVRVLFENNRQEIDAELESKIPVVMGNYGYVLHTDHSIPGNVEYDTYEYFIKKGLELGKYKTF